TRRQPPRVEDRHHVHERKDQRKTNEKAQHRAPQLASPGVKRGGKGSAHPSFLPSRNSLKSEPRYSLSTGFTSTLYAPATLALRTTGGEAAAVTTKTVALGWSRLIAGNRSIPSTSGNATSNRIRSNRFPLRQAKASLPLAASTTGRQPARQRCCRRSLRINGTSSMINAPPVRDPCASMVTAGCSHAHEGSRCP